MSKQEALWVLRAQYGDGPALDSLMQSIGPVLVRYLVRYLGQEAAAEDLAQEVLLVIYRKLKWLRNPQLVRPWALRIASRQAARFLRENARLEHFQDSSEGSLLDPEAERRVGVQLETLSVARLVETLPPAARAAVWLHYAEGLSIAELAEVLEISTGTAKSRLSYGLSRLRREIEAVEGATPLGTPRVARSPAEAPTREAPARARDGSQ